MKKLRFVSGVIASALAALFVISSCVKEETSVSAQLKQKGDVLYRFEATPDNGLTKAYAEITGNGYSGGDVTWEEGDQVAVCNGKNVVVFDFMGYNSSGRAEFRSMDGIQYKYDCGLVMVYPASLVASPSDWTLSGSTINVVVNLPKTQPFASNQKCAYAPMIAHVGKDDIEKYKVNKVYFKNMCGLLGIKITGDVDKQQSSSQGLNSIVFSTTQKCSGKGTISVAQNNSGSTFNPVITMNSTGSYDNVTLDFSSVNSNPSETSGQWYYFYLPAGTYSAPTLAVNFKKANANMVDRVVNSDLTIVRNVLSHGNNFFQTLFGGGGATGSAVGTESNPYLIRDLDDLLELSAKVNGFNATYLSSTSSAAEASPSATGVTYSTDGKYYKLVNNLTLTSAFLSQFKPIGTSANPFKGTFDGNGKTITGFTYTSTTDGAGFFGYVNGGTIKNLTLSNVNLTSSAKYVGAFAGSMTNNSSLIGCTLTAGGSSGTSRVKQTGAESEGTGGLVGYIHTCTVSDCETRGGMTAANTITVESASEQVGGVVGRSIKGYISNTATTKRSASVSVSGTSRVGGVVGHQNAGYIRCNKDGQTDGLCVNQATVTGSGNYVGGIVGSINTQAQINLVTTKNDSFNNGKVTGSGNCVGGIVGQSAGGVITISSGASANVKTVSGSDDVGGIIGQIADNSSTSEVDVTSVTIDGTYDSCSTNTAAITGSNNVGGVAGNIKTTNAVITGCKNVGAITTKVVDQPNVANGYYCGGIAGYVKGATITNCKSTAAIKGNGRVGGIAGMVVSVTISGSSVTGNITSCNRGAGGLVGAQDDSNGKINITGLGNNTSNPTYSGGTVQVTSTAGTLYAGGILGYGMGTVTIKNCGVANATVSTVNSHNVGGIAGFVGPGSSGETVKTSWKSLVQDCTIASNCKVSGKRTSGTDYGKRAGGICGEIDDCRVTGCTNNGTVSTTNTVAGGIVGISRGRVDNCRSYGNVTSSNSHAGGIVGLMMERSSTVDCHSYCNVTATTDYAGGIAGAMLSEDSAGAEVNTNKSYISGCVTHTNGQTISAADCAGGIVGYMNSTGKAPVKSSSNAKEALAFAKAQSTIYDCKVGTEGTGTAITIKTTRSINVFGFAAGVVGGINAPGGTATVGLCQVGKIRTSGNSASLPKISSATGYVGGIVGGNSCREDDLVSTKPIKISYCFFCANASAGSSGGYSLGGILGDTGGRAKATIEKCAVVRPNLTSKYYNTYRMAGVGGVVGRASSNLAISDCAVIDTRSAESSTTGNFITMSGGTASGSLGGFGGVLGFATTNCADLLITNCHVNVGTSFLKLGSDFSTRPTVNNYGTYRYSHIVGYSGQTSSQVITITNCYWRNSMAPINRANTGNMDLYQVIANTDDADFCTRGSSKKAWSPSNLPDNKFSNAVNCAASAIVAAKDTWYNSNHYLDTYLNYVRTDEEKTAGFSWKQNTGLSNYIMYDCCIPGVF
ncbi:MAG: hypothetical protein IJU69_01010 [Bacteroidales bacterium]|nr:hypothetical protein [Bacteroidales bacterium]